MNVRISFIHTAQNCKEYKCPSTGKWINSFRYIDIMRYCVMLKRINYSHMQLMDESQKPAEHKEVTKEYDFIFEILEQAK